MKSREGDIGVGLDREKGYFQKFSSVGRMSGIKWVN